LGSNDFFLLSLPVGDTLKRYPLTEWEGSEKILKLNDLHDALDFNQLVVFVKTEQRAAPLDKLLRKCLFPSMCIHSDLKQEERLDRYRKSKEYLSRNLVSTNLFGRGVDIARRARRFGTKELAITFVSEIFKNIILEQESRILDSGLLQCSTVNLENGSKLRGFRVGG